MSEWLHCDHCGATALPYYSVGWLKLIGGRGNALGDEGEWHVCSIVCLRAIEIPGVPDEPPQ